jgi:glucosamine--fructose-6-phosphate aminotransferase (isomerizing)
MPNLSNRPWRALRLGGFLTVSLYDAPVVTSGEGACASAISQSGRSPDMLSTVERQKASGALVVALVNDETSPLAAMADVVLPLCAGPEISVAATKSYIASLAGIAAIVAAWRGDADLQTALAALPAQLDAAFQLDWSPLAAGLVEARTSSSSRAVLVWPSRRKRR